MPTLKCRCQKCLPQNADVKIPTSKCPVQKAKIKIPKSQCQMPTLKSQCHKRLPQNAEVKMPTSKCLAIHFNAPRKGPDRPIPSKVRRSLHLGLFLHVKKIYFIISYSPNKGSKNFAREFSTI